MLQPETPYTMTVENKRNSETGGNERKQNESQSLMNGIQEVVGSIPIGSTN